MQARKFTRTITKEVRRAVREALGERIICRPLQGHAGNPRRSMQRGDLGPVRGVQHHRDCDQRSIFEGGLTWEFSRRHDSRRPEGGRVAYAKVGMLGFAGSGKTYTATMFAIGLHQLIAELTGVSKPIGFFDTEDGSDYVEPIFHEHGIELVPYKSRTFDDLMSFTRDCENETDIYLTDLNLPHLERGYRVIQGLEEDKVPGHERLGDSKAQVGGIHHAVPHQQTALLPPRARVLGV